MGEKAPNGTLEGRALSRYVELVKQGWWPITTACALATGLWILPHRLQDETMPQWSQYWWLPTT